MDKGISLIVKGVKDFLDILQMDLKILALQQHLKTKILNPKYSFIVICKIINIQKTRILN